MSEIPGHTNTIERKDPTENHARHAPLRLLEFELQESKWGVAGVVLGTFCWCPRRPRPSGFSSVFKMVVMVALFALLLSVVAGW